MRRKIKGRERFPRQSPMACIVVKQERAVPAGRQFRSYFTQTLPCGKGTRRLAGTIRGAPGFFAKQEVLEAMIDDEKHMGGRMEAEFRRQMRSGQMNRFVGTLPHYAVDRELPDRFVKLLRQIDKPHGNDRSALHAGGTRNQN
ncbi:hypothetical protein [Mesorhizobium sp. IMUNJ 23232]|uniref:hypothetical protein n=1 Tax=Mesorhizobium sp. IMUNJ 23232 TaxID=3376064 RepID=UPI0037A69BAC